MIDFHSHFLPGIDDGAQTDSESLQMLSESLSQGVKLCYATPHCQVHSENAISEFIEKRLDSLNRLKKAADAERVKIPEIKLGAEVFLDNDITAFGDYKKLCFEGTDYILLEFPMTKINPKAFDWIYEMTLNGVRPVVAHLDRYPDRETIIGNLADMNAVYQINASRFIFWAGKRIVKDILKHRSIKCIVATDMHNTKFRGPNLGKAYAKVSKADSSLAEKLFVRNAEKFVENEL